MKREVVCTHCNHRQRTKSNSKYITCSSCQKKFNTMKDNNNIPKKKEAAQVRLD